MSTCTKVELSKISQKDNSRGQVRSKELDSLMQSIKENGLLQPIGLKPKGKRFEVIFGHRRLMAVKKLGYKTIQATVLKDLKPKDTIILNLVENLQRRDINIAERGRYMLLLEKQGMTRKEISVRLSCSLGYVKNCIDTFKLVPAELRSSVVAVSRAHGVKDGKIPMSFVSKIIDASRASSLSKAEKTDLFKSAMGGKLTTEEVATVCKGIVKGKTVKQAVKEAKTITHFSFRFDMTNKEVKRLLKKHRCKTLSPLFAKILTGKVKETVQLKV
jgi:ParB/RepB/Spo0J family partition protein